MTVPPLPLGGEPARQKRIDFKGGRVVYWCTAVHFRFLASKALHVPCIMQNLSVFHNFSDGLGRKIRYHEMEQRLCQGW